MATDIPKSDKALRTIGEVAEEINVATHVLRFWEGKFSQIKPKKRRGRRYYRSEDVAVIKKIQDLLYNQGYTIRGVQKFLSKNDNASIDKLGSDNIITSNNLADKADLENDVNLEANSPNDDNIQIKAPVIEELQKINLQKSQRLALEEVLYQLIKARNILQEISFSNS